jgi:hypothetical protein
MKALVVVAVIVVACLCVGGVVGGFNTKINGIIYVAWNTGM